MGGDGLQGLLRVEPGVGDDGAGAVRVGGEDPDHHAKAVEERHGEAHAVGRRVAEQLTDEVPVVEQVVVGQGHAFGESGGSRGVLQVDGVVGVEFVGDRFEALGHFGARGLREFTASRQQGGEEFCWVEGVFGVGVWGGFRGGFRVLVGVWRVDVDELEAGHLGVDFPGNGHEVGVWGCRDLADEHGHAGLFDHVFKFVGTVCRVDVDQNCAQFGACVHDDDPFGEVLGPNSYAVALLDATLD